MQNIKVSIVIPVYNVESHFLRECLDSVVNQTYRNLEIILIDDGSIDGSGDICDEYAANDNRIIVRHKENEGQSATRNLGIELATGKYLWFIDNDDWAEQSAVEVLVNTAEKVNCDVILFEYIQFKNNERRPLRFMQYDGIQTGIGFLSSNGICFPPWIKFFNRNFLIENKLRFVKGLLCEDPLFYVDFLIAAKTVYPLDAHLYNYRVHENSTMMRESNEHLIKLCDSYNFMFHELYSMLRRERISEYIFKLINTALFPQYLKRQAQCRYKKHRQIMCFLAENGLFKDLSEVIKDDHNLILCGAGEFTEISIKKYSLKPSVIYDKNADSIKSFCGVPVILPEFEIKSKNDIIVICTDNSEVIEGIKNVYNNAPNVLSVTEYLMWLDYN